MLKRPIAVFAIFAFLTGAAMPQTPDEAALRKARSIALLQVEGVPTIDHLPMIETVKESGRRESTDVARRAIALMIVAVKGETNDHRLGQQLIEQFDARSFFTPKEQAFMDNPDPSDQDRVIFTWHYEGVHVLLWALGITPRLGRPDTICDVPKIAETLRELGTDGLLSSASLRSQAELLDATDLIYRYHWAVVNARLKNQPTPAGLDSGVVQERHHALRWLIDPDATEWDDIVTHT